MAAVSAAQVAVVQQGGVIHEDAVWDAAEAALDRASTEVLVETINGTRKYKPQGRWGVTADRN